MDTRIDLRPGQVAIVIGIDHKIQRFIPTLAANHPCNALRLRFRGLLEQITGGYRVDVIYEEAKRGAVSVAQTVADREHIPYRIIEPPRSLERNTKYPTYTPSIRPVRRLRLSERKRGTRYEHHTWWIESSNPSRVQKR